MAFPDIRKLTYQNPTSGKYYEVVYKLNAAGTVDVVGYLLGTNRINTDPTFDNTKITAVVLTSKVADVFGLNAKGNAHLIAAPIYDVSNRAAAGAALSTLLV